MPEIDLEKPGKLTASAEHAKDYTFYIVSNKPNFTAEAFEQNPNVASGPDLLFKSPAIPDAGGRAFVDLDPKAKELKDKLKEERTDAKVVLVGTMKNYPDKRKAAVQTFTLIKNVASIKLKPLVGATDAGKWVAYHHTLFFIEMEVRGLPEVFYDISPKKQPVPMLLCCYVSKAPGSIVATQPGDFLFGGIGDRHPPTPKCQFLPNLHGRPWVNMWGGTYQFGLNPRVQRYVLGVYPRYGPAQWTITMSGTGRFAGIKDQCTVQFNGAHPHPGD